MEDRETARMRKYGESKTTRIIMATVPHVTSGLGLRKLQADGFLLTRVYLPTNLHGITFQNATIFTVTVMWMSNLRKPSAFTYYTVEEQKWKGMTITLDGRTWYMRSQEIRMAAQMTQNNGLTNNISVTDRLMIKLMKRWWQAVRGKKWFYSNYFITNTQNKIITLSTELP